MIFRAIRPVMASSASCIRTRHIYRRVDVASVAAISGRTTPRTLSMATWASSHEIPANTSTHDYDRIPPDVASLIEEYTQKKQTSSSLQTLMKTGRGDYLGKDGEPRQTQAFLGRMGQRLAKQRILMQDACFLRQEIPIRLAHRIRDLDRVPMMRDMPSVQTVKGIYVQSFLEMVDFPEIKTPEQEQEFARMLGTLYTKHANGKLMIQLCCRCVVVVAVLVMYEYASTILLSLWILPLLSTLANVIIIHLFTHPFTPQPLSSIGKNGPRCLSTPRGCPIGTRAGFGRNRFFVGV
jgi:hypothetical protein